MERIILGAGLCADAVRRRLPDAKVVLLEESKQRFYSLQCSWRQPPILYSKEKKGLSSYYHGIAPFSILTNDKWESCRKEYNLPTVSASAFGQTNLTYVKFLPIRSGINAVNMVNSISVNQKIHTHPVYLCMSVVGNLQFLIANKMIPGEVNIGDHLVVKLGCISFENLRLHFGPSFSFLTRTGTLFKHIDIEKCARLFFRPNLQLSHKDFSKSIPQLGKLFLSLDPRKLASGIYNKIGYPRLKTSYEVFAQIPVDNMYTLTVRGVRHSPSAERIALDKIHYVSDKCRLAFPSFKPYPLNPFNILPGIHLHYDRDLLKEVPQNINVFDNSLVEDRLIHPAVISAFASYNLCN